MNAPKMQKAAACRQAAFLKTSNDTAKNSAPHVIKQITKRVIVSMALWGLLPAGLASWLIRRFKLEGA